jgi:hypothetical protein
MRDPSATLRFYEETPEQFAMWKAAGVSVMLRAGKWCSGAEEFDSEAEAVMWLRDCAIALGRPHG